MAILLSDQPCRDPIDHALSYCNHHSNPKHRNKENYPPVDCEAGFDSVVKQLEHCINPETARRFNNGILKSPYIHAKCFDYRQTFTTYMDYMDRKLQRRRIVAEYTFRPTNKKRDRNAECLWKDLALMAEVRKQLLANFDYYQYCESCLGTANDITSPAFVEPSYPPIARASLD